MTDAKTTDLVNALTAFGIKVQAIPDVVVVDPPPVTGATGKFYVSGGKIIRPDGKEFLARGLNINDDQMATVCSNDACEPLLKLFPGTNMVRLACRTYPDASVYDQFVSRMSKKGIVVAFDDHTGISQPPYTGDRLAQEVDWFKRIAARFKDNTYVWINGFNEPGNGTNLAGITAQQVAIYNAIRSVSPDVINMLELPSGGNPGLCGANAKGYDGKGPMPPAAYANMHNIVWGPHFYGWMPKYSTDRATVQASFIGSVESASGIRGVQSIQSADGLVPVIIGEFGDSTTGNPIDANGTLVVDVVGNSGYGYLAWHWQAATLPGDILTRDGVITPLGKQVAALIAKSAAADGSPIVVVSPTSGDIILTPGDGKSGVTSDGGVWSLDGSGAVILNGSAIPGGSGTSSVVITSGKAVAYDGKTGVGYTWDGKLWREASPGNSQPPPTGTPNVTPGQWITGSVPGMPYMLLLPHNYTADRSWPAVVYLHQLDWGISYNQPALKAAVDKWFNNVKFRTDNPAIIIVPMLDQSADKGGTTINFGGVGTNITAGRDGVLAALQQVRNSYNVNSKKISVTGNSLGGLGSWELVAFKPDIFCAAMPMAGASYTRDIVTTAAALKNKPIWAIHGSNDTNVPLAWDRGMAAQMKAIGGVMKYTEIAGAGHDVWDTAYPDPQYLGWLISQSM